MVVAEGHVSHKNCRLEVLRLIFLGRRRWQSDRLVGFLCLADVVELLDTFLVEELSESRRLFLFASLFEELRE